MMAMFLVIALARMDVLWRSLTRAHERQVYSGYEREAPAPAAARLAAA